MPPADDPIYIPRGEFALAQRYVEQTMGTIAGAVETIRQTYEKATLETSQRVSRLEVRMDGVEQSVSSMAGDVKLLTTTVASVGGKIDEASAAIGNRRSDDKPLSTVALALRVALAAIALAASLVGAYAVGSGSTSTADINNAAQKASDTTMRAVEAQRP